MRVFVAAVVVLFWVVGGESNDFPAQRKREQFDIVPGAGRFEFVKDSLNWTNAHKACTTNGGHLAFPNSIATANVLLNMMITEGSFQIHLGFHDLFKKGDYFTVKDESILELGYQQWTIGQPDADKNKNCGTLVRFQNVSGLAVTNCSTTLQFICQYKLWDDYDLIPGYGYYKFHTSYVNWTKAREICRSEGTDLLVVNSAEEKDAVVAKYGTEFIVESWYGVHHRFAYHNFVSIFDELSEETGYTNWTGSYPNNVDNGLYGLHYTAIYLGGVDVGSIHTTGPYFPFICKHNLHGRE